MFDTRFVSTPEIGVERAQADRELRVGWRLELARSDRMAIEAGIEATRRELAYDETGPEHGLALRLRARWWNSNPGLVSVVAGRKPATLRSDRDVDIIARPKTCRRLWWDNGRMTKSDLIQRIAQTQSHLIERDVALAVNMMLEHMAARLAGGGRIEIRGFGSFSVRFRRARVGRNPRTGTPVSLSTRHAPRFKLGKRLRERLNGRQRFEDGQEVRMTTQGDK